VQLVAVRHRLDRRITDARVLRRRVVGGRRRQHAHEDKEENDDLERQLVSRLRKDLRHNRIGLGDRG